MAEALTNGAAGDDSVNWFAPAPVTSPSDAELASLAAEAEQNDPTAAVSWDNATEAEQQQILADAAAYRRRLGAQLRVIVELWREQGHADDAIDAWLRSGYGVSLASLESSVATGGREGPDLPPLRFLSASELALAVSPQIEWALDGYIAFGAITELISPPKAGKSTLIGYVTRALVTGAPCLGRSTTRTPVVILTEQPPTSFRQILERAGLTDRDDVRILLWRDARGAAWPDVVTAAIAECERIRGRLLVVDTLPAFAGIRGDGENDAGTALEAMAPLQAAAAADLAVLVVRHARKGAGAELADAGRGSGAFTGAADIVLRLARKDNAPPTSRVLSALSRFDETPAEIVIDLTSDGYDVLGDAASVAFARARSTVLDHVPDVGGLPVGDLVERTALARTTVQAALGALVNAGDVLRLGTGKRGDPYRYVRFLPDVPGGTNRQLPAETARMLSAAPTGYGAAAESNDSGPAATGGMSVSDRMASIFEGAGEA